MHRYPQNSAVVLNKKISRVTYNLNNSKFFLNTQLICTAIQCILFGNTCLTKYCDKRTLRRKMARIVTDNVSRCHTNRIKRHTKPFFPHFLYFLIILLGEIAACQKKSNRL